MIVRRYFDFDKVLIKIKNTKYTINSTETLQIGPLKEKLSSNPHPEIKKILRKKF